MPYHVSPERFSKLVAQAVELLPPAFREFLEEVAIEIRDRPTAQQRAETGEDDLLGLYVGRAMTERSVEDSGRLPDVIYIFQEPHEQICDSEEDLIEEVRITVLHEIGHYFGMDEDDLEELGYG